MPAGKGEAVEITSGAGLMLSENVWLAVNPPAAVTVTLNEDVPYAVGTPETNPPADSVKPAGNAPDATDQA